MMDTAQFLLAAQLGLLVLFCSNWTWNLKAEIVFWSKISNISRTHCHIEWADPFHTPNLTYHSNDVENGLIGRFKFFIRPDVPLAFRNPGLSQSAPPSNLSQECLSWVYPNYTKEIRRIFFRSIISSDHKICSFMYRRAADTLDMYQFWQLTSCNYVKKKLRLEKELSNGWHLNV